MTRARGAVAGLAAPRGAGVTTAGAGCGSRAGEVVERCGAGGWLLRGRAGRAAETLEHGIGEEGLEEDIEILDAVPGLGWAGGEDDETRRRFLLREGVEGGESVGVGQVEIDEGDGAAAAGFEPGD